MGSDEGIPTIQAVIHYPAACLGALLALVALAFVVNRMGLIVWLPWIVIKGIVAAKRSQVEATKEYWRVHQWKDQRRQESLCVAA